MGRRWGDPGCDASTLKEAREDRTAVDSDVNTELGALHKLSHTLEQVPIPMYQAVNALLVAAPDDLDLLIEEHRA